MEQLYAPWRIEWVERETDPIDGCPFCVLPDRDDGPETDLDARIVARGEYTYLLLNDAPYNPGHAMVIPYDHVGAWGDLPDAAMLEHGRLKAATIDAMNRAMEPCGFNTGMNLGGSAAGGSIDDHIHTHVVPRWTGDTNFMPIMNDTKVIVEAVDRTWTRLREAFAELDCARGSETGAVKTAAVERGDSETGADDAGKPETGADDAGKPETGAAKTGDVVTGDAETGEQESKGAEKEANDGPATNAVRVSF